MEWTKIPTDLLQSRKSDKEILAITKYQLLWALLERQPEDNVALRYMTSNQLQQALNYATAIQRQVDNDIKTVISNRKRQKLFYEKNQTLSKKPNGYTNEYTNEYTNHQTTNADKIREDKIRKEIKEINKENTVFLGQVDQQVVLGQVGGQVVDKDKVKNNRYGECKNVLLTEEQYKKLSEENDNFDLAIEKLDTWLGTSGGKNRNKNHYAYFKSNSWVWNDLRKKELMF